MAVAGAERDPVGMETSENVRRALVRPKDDRWLGGVCVGLGEYFDLNPAIYRIAFAALAFAGGTGILLYAAAWLVIPEEGADDSIAAAELRKHRNHPVRLLGLALIAAVALAVLSSIHFWPSPGNFWVLAGLLLVALFWARGRVVLGILLGLFVVIVAGVLLAVSVPLFSGIGERTVEPVVAGDVHSKYELGIGKLQLDFSDVEFPKGQTFVEAHLGIGDLHVIVPADASVDVVTRVQAGDADVLGRHEDGTHVHNQVHDRVGSGRVLVLDLRNGLGKVLVERR
jgi:phage shock protein PspC (stress-responsive transcriptional regulator)